MTQDLKTTKEKLEKEREERKQLKEKLKGEKREIKFPIVVAIVLKAIYTKGVNTKKQRNKGNDNDNCPAIIKSNKWNYRKFGCGNEDQVVGLVNLVSVDFFDSNSK